MLRDLIAGKAGMYDFYCVFLNLLFPKKLLNDALLLSVTDVPIIGLAMT